MGAFIEVITNPKVMQFLSTYGLATLLVLWFILWRDRRLWNELNQRYKDLNHRYEELQGQFNAYDSLRKRYRELTDHFQILNESYINLSECIRPETVKMSTQQTKKINDTAIDRDLFKLYVRICEKIENKRQDDLPTFLKETILDTNETWEDFRPPFRNPKVRSLTDLHAMYLNSGGQLKHELEKIIDSDVEDKEKKENVFNLLSVNAINMKNQLRDYLRKEEKGEPFEPPINNNDKNTTIESPAISKSSNEDQTK